MSLVVAVFEDSPTYREMIIEQVRDAFRDVLIHLADNMVSALELIRNQERIDLALVDANLILDVSTGDDGRAIENALKERFPEVIIIEVSTLAESLVNPNGRLIKDRLHDNKSLGKLILKLIPRT
jgi:CheY-like chemotaxis protein